MRILLFLLKLPLFLVAEAFLWLVLFIAWDVFLFDKKERRDAIGVHGRLVDWLRGMPREYLYRTGA